MRERLWPKLTLVAWLGRNGALKSFRFSYPVEQGGQKYAFADLVKNDGEYVIIVKMDGRDYGHYPISVQGGKVVPHPRQTMTHTPRTEWLVPRRNSGLDSADPIFYLPRSASSTTAPVKTDTNVRATKGKSWEVIPDADPQRPFQLVHTKVMTRRDTPLAVGDGIIAFATGRQGVAYLKVGELQQRSIPDGQTYRGDLFYVCGKKIVLSNQYNLFVHDTVTGATMGIEDHDIHLRYRKHSLYGSRLVDADGYLVATVNDPSRVQDRAVIKILDVSDDEPQILGIRGSLPSADVTSVKVSAQHGYVAVSSKRRQAIYVASVADGAELQPYDVSGFDSVGAANMALLDRHVVYQDGAGFPSLRVLDLETGAVVTPAHGQHGGGWGTTVATNGRVTTWPTRDPRSTFVVTRDFDQVSLLSNSGDKVSTARNHGRWGEGTSGGRCSRWHGFLSRQPEH